MVAGSKLDRMLFFSQYGVEYLVAQAEIERQVAAHAPVVLDIGKVHVASKVGDEHAAERVLRPQPEHEIGKIVEIARRGAGGAAELAVVGIASVERVDVLDLGVDLLELVAALERVRLHRPGIVHLRVVDRRVLPLRVGRLAAEVGVSRNHLRRQTAGDARIGRKARQAELVERARRSECRGVLASLGPRVAESDFEERRRVRDPGRADHELAVARVDVTVATAARGQRNSRLVVGRQIPEAVAAEHRQGRAGLEVDLGASLVRVRGERLQDAVVVRRARDIRVRQRREHFARECRHRNRAPGRIHRACSWVAHIDRQDALALHRRRNRREGGHLARLPQAFVVGKEERPVPDDRPADHAAELVAIELRLPRGRLEEARRVQARIAEELPARPVQRVGAAAIVDVDRGAGGASVLRAQVVGDDLELADGVGRRLHDLVREPLVAGAVGVVVDAVDQEVVERAPKAVDVQRALTRRIARRE